MDFTNPSALPSFLLGVMSLSFQILLMREFISVFYGNELTIGLLLAAWLFWGGLGSLSAAALTYTPKRLASLMYGSLFMVPFVFGILRGARFILGSAPGESIGVLPPFIFAFFLSMFLSFPMGILFVFNTRLLEENLSRVYILESLGAALSGTIVFFILIPAMSNWNAAALMGLGCATALYITSRQQPVTFVCVCAALCLLPVLDIPSQRIDWKPYKLIHSTDSLYGKLQVLQTKEEIHIYSNHCRLLTIPDPSSAEEIVHFALLQRPLSERVLLIGGTAEGSIREALKYPNTHVDALEIDPKINRIVHLYASLDGLPRERLRLFYQDGRAFLYDKAEPGYDAIILNLPDPATAQLNRFYTVEFFRLCRSRLGSEGILAFRLASAENYISPSLQMFLRSMYKSLKLVFPYVDIVPGSTNIFLGSEAPLNLDPDLLAANLKETGVQTRYVRPEFFHSRLSPLRREYISEMVKKEGGNSLINRDMKPVSYLFFARLWSSRFKGLESRIYDKLFNLSRFWLLDFPLLIFFLTLLLFLILKKKSSLALIPLAVLGLTTLVTELVVILIFQINYGSLYSRISLLFTCFMAGLFLGSMEARRRISRPAHLLAVQAGFVILLATLRTLLPLRLPSLIYPIILGSLGFLSGELFIISNGIYLSQRKKNIGTGYALDLLGSFIGALAATSILLPLFGLASVINFLLILNSASLIFVLFGHRFPGVK